MIRNRKSPSRNSEWTKNSSTLTKQVQNILTGEIEQALQPALRR
jgi:hypothetical protein